MFALKKVLILNLEENLEHRGICFIEMLILIIIGRNTRFRTKTNDSFPGAEAMHIYSSHLFHK